VEGIDVYPVETLGRLVANFRACYPIDALRRAWICRATFLLAWPITRSSIDIITI